MDSKTLTFLGLISGPRQYRIPPFQRAYSWERDERETLWLDILTQYQRLSELWDLDEDTREERLQNIPSHYLGTIVLSGPSALGVPRSDVIDGQQRITTLLLAVSALRDVWAKQVLSSKSKEKAEESANIRQSLTDTYLKNPGKTGSDQYRAIPLTIDKKSFEAVIDFDGSGKFNAASYGFSEGDSQRVIQAYTFFSTEMRRRTVTNNPQLERFKGLFPLNFAILEQVIAHRLSVIAIETKSLDDTNAIFESLNAKGKPLSQIDLLRNYIFMILKGKASEVLKTYWEPMETVHLRPKEVELLVWANVVSQGTNVLQKRTYRTVQAELRSAGATAAKAEEYVKELHRKSASFKCILRPAEETDAGLQVALRRVAKAGGKTAVPLILWLYEQVYAGLCDKTEATSCISYIESYLVRRFLVDMAPNNLNSQFGTMLAKLNREPAFGPETGTVKERLGRVMLASAKDWPDDETVRTGIEREMFYRNGTTEQRILILESLDRSFGYQLAPSYVESDESIEHIMPQTLTAAWRADLEEIGEDAGAAHDRLLHTLGNLTVVTPEINSSLSNRPFEQKLEILSGTDYKMSKDIRSYDSVTEGRFWGSAGITARSADLAVRACEVWGRPAVSILQSAPTDAPAESEQEFTDQENGEPFAVQFSSSIEEDLTLSSE